MSEATQSFSEAAIFGRTIANNDNVSPELAEHILSLTISEADQQHVTVLLEKSQSGELSEQEREELNNLNHIADLLSLWHSKARRVVKANS